MVSDVRERMQGLTRDVAQLPPPAAAVVRREAERRRTLDVVLVTAVVLALAGSAFVWARGGGEVETSLPASSTTSKSTASASAAESDDSVGGWVPGPGTRIQESEAYVWVVGETSPHPFCGSTSTWHDPVDVERQVVFDSDGHEINLVVFTPRRRDDAMQLFKLNYASCSVEGRAESVAGPRNLWSYGTLVGAAEVRGGSLYLVEVGAVTPGNVPSRNSVERLLDLWPK